MAEASNAAPGDAPINAPPAIAMDVTKLDTKKLPYYSMVVPHIRKVFTEAFWNTMSIEMQQHTIDNQAEVLVQGNKDREEAGRIAQALLEEEKRAAVAAARSKVARLTADLSQVETTLDNQGKHQAAELDRLQADHRARKQDLSSNHRSATDSELAARREVAAYEGNDTSLSPDNHHKQRRHRNSSPSKDERSDAPSSLEPTFHVTGIARPLDGFAVPSTHAADTSPSC